MDDISVHPDRLISTVCIAVLSSAHLDHQSQTSGVRHSNSKNSWAAQLTDLLEAKRNHKEEQKDDGNDKWRRLQQRSTTFTHPEYSSAPFSSLFVKVVGACSCCKRYGLSTPAKYTRW